MSAPQIPNLNTLRRGGGGGARGRFRGRGGLGINADSDNRPHQVGGNAARDKVVQGTDNDASTYRLSAVELGYLDDPFARALTASASVSGPGMRRFPIINRGTYVRTIAIDNLAHRFLDDEGHSQPPRKKQIISLGAGSDTRVFRLFAARPSLQLVYHELDFSVNTAAKIRAIRAAPLLQRTLRIENPNISAGSNDVMISAAGDALHSPVYHIHPVDLRLLAAEAHMTGNGSQLQSSSCTPSDTTTYPHPRSSTLLPEIDPSLPTLLISECCLIYLSPTDAANVVDYFTKTLFPPSSPLGLIIYEPIRPNDAFGQTMVSNLATRGIQLQTLHRYASLDAQRQRLRDHGFDAAQGAADIDFIWEKWVNEIEKERVAGLEMLDEIEEWRLLAQHYCVAWGWRDGEDTGAGAFESWKDVEGQ